MDIGTKAAAVDTALRTERGNLRALGGADNLRLANELNGYVQHGPHDSKARLYDLLVAPQVRA